MKSHKMIGWVIGIPILVIALVLIIVFHEPEKNGITRAMAAKSVALAVMSPEDLKTWQKEYGASHFPAKTLNEWYVPYLDYLYENGFLDEAETPADEAAAQGQLTYGEAERIAGQIAPHLKTLVRATKKNRDRSFPEQSWWLFYDSLLKEADPDGKVEQTDILLYGTPDNVPDAPAWTAYTNRGTMEFSGLALDHYIDHELHAYVRDTEILHVLEDRGSQVTYQNVWLVSGDEKELQVYVGDITRTIPFQKNSKDTKEVTGNLADLHLKDGKITGISVKKERITGKVLSVNEDAIEIEGYGAVPLDAEFKVLKLYGELQRQQLKDILVGYDIQEFVVARGKLCAALTVREFDAKTIRVLLMGNGFKGLFHDSVTLSCGGTMKMIQGEDETEIQPGELSFASGDEKLSAGRIILEPQDGYEITVSSLDRAQGAPSYAGRLEVIQEEEGLVLINDLYLEDYLKKVVPSEMPPSYEIEALKAQAVCARTYAYKQIQGNTYSQYGAHVDDSTNFQVYNNTEPDERADEAVQETYGKLLLYQDQPVDAFYFSTSCGTTTDASVWGSDPKDSPYLKCGSLQPSRKTLDLESNKAFLAFIKDKDYPSYDSSFPMYRWETVTDTSILTDNIDGVGTVESLSITNRGAGGVAQELTVTGSDGEKKVTGQNAIRAALGDERLTLTRLDQKKVDGWPSLPSGYLALEEGKTDENGVKTYKIYGGGYGHGVGMSQNGAQGMAKTGAGYEKILKFFYDGTEVK